MSPLQAPPSFGYVDGQRVTNWDGPVVWSVSSAVNNIPVASPVLDVSRYSHLSGKIGSGLNRFVMTATWFADAAATTTLGATSFVVSSGIFNSMQPRISNMGPFVRLQALAIGGANFTIFATIIATNRDDPLPTVPVQQVLISVISAAIGAATAITSFPSDYFAGPVTVEVFSGIAGMVCEAQVIDQSGVPQHIKSATGTAGAWTSVPFVAPLGAWDVIVSNPGAASTYSLLAYPSLMGAS